jgi:hypothetical protein
MGTANTVASYLVLMRAGSPAKNRLRLTERLTAVRVMAKAGDAVVAVTSLLPRAGAASYTVVVERA